MGKMSFVLCFVLLVSVEVSAGMDCYAPSVSNFLVHQYSTVEQLENDLHDANGRHSGVVRKLKKLHAKLGNILEEESPDFYKLNSLLWSLESTTCDLKRLDDEIGGLESSIPRAKSRERMEEDMDELQKNTLYPSYRSEWGTSAINQREAVDCCKYH
jgi:hypothetical protein